MNELTNFILMYHVMCFAGFVPEVHDRYYIGWAFIAFMGANLMVHIIFLVI